MMKSIIIASAVTAFLAVSANTLHHGDCLSVMAQIPDQAIDLVVSDPPYGMAYRSNMRKATERFDPILNDVAPWQLIEEYLAECHRILKDDTAIYLFCSWHHIDRFKPLFERFFKLKNLLVWNKNSHGTGDLKGSYGPKHELVLFGHKGRSLIRGKRHTDVINCPKVPPSKLIHPTEKPIDLLEKFILNNSDEGDLIFDGFVGGGSTCLAAIRSRRKYVGVELEEKYYRVAKHRVNPLNDEDAEGQPLKK